MSRFPISRPSHTDRSNLRARIAREAANLLYLGIEKEYKQAKQKAAVIFGGHFLPTNLEIALELDRISEEREGQSRKERLAKMRREALKLMEILQNCNPVLVGSVWRGTVNHESDIDITVYDDVPIHVLKTIEQGESKVLHTEWVATTEQGQKKQSFHIQLESPTKEKVEIIVRSPEEAKRREKCDVYGDKITGLCLPELRKLVRESPTQRFLPF